VRSVGTFLDALTDGRGDHNREGDSPDDRDRLVRVIERLPAAGPKRLAYRKVALHRDRHECKHAHAHGDA